MMAAAGPFSFAPDQEKPTETAKPLPGVTLSAATVPAAAPAVPALWPGGPLGGLPGTPAAAPAPWAFGAPPAPGGLLPGFGMHPAPLGPVPFFPITVTEPVVASKHILALAGIAVSGLFYGVRSIV